MADDNGNGNGAAWYQPAESLKTSDPEIWTSFEKGIQSGSITDLPSFIKKGISAEKRLGAALVPPGKDAKPEEVEAFKEKIFSTGHIPRPPAIPEKYTIAKPEGLPEGAWRDDLQSTFENYAKKHGLTQEAVDEGMGIYLEAFSLFGEKVVRDREATLAEIKSRAEKAGVTLEEVQENWDRWIAARNYSDEMKAKLSRSGFADDPDFLWELYEAQKASGNSVRDMGGATEQMSKDKAASMAEARDIQTNPNNPKHSLYKANDAATVRYVTELLTKVDGSQVTL